MRFSLKNALRSGVRQLLDHPQLWLTVVVAVAIVGSFVYMADRFLSIAQDAQDRLTDVRVGALQDAFSPLAAELWDKPDVLQGYMQRMTELNPTIVEFDIVTQNASDTWQVLLSAEPQNEGQQVYRQDLLLSLAKSDPSNSYTVQETDGATRFFYTARAVQSRAGVLDGVVLTRQTLSAVDQALSDSVQSAMITLVLVLLFLLLIFFRHARIIDYTVLYRKLREVDTLKDDFISMASHELRAPLTAIRGYAEMLKDTHLADTDRTTSLDRIDISAQQLDALVADMLDVSRIEQGRMQLKSESIDTFATLNELCDVWDIKAKEKGVTLLREIAPGLRITVDPDRFRQIVINLVSNAIKYTPKGTITVHSTADTGFTLRVSDTGIGMTTEERDGLFKKFYRAGNQEVRQQSGTGLGLWITKQLVEVMGGHIAVESIKGVGSHFIVTFPLS